MNFQIPTVAESGQHSFSSSLEKKGIFSDCGPKINGGKGGGVESNMSKSNRDIERFIPWKPGGVKNSIGSIHGEVVQELYIDNSLSRE